MNLYIFFREIKDQLLISQFGFITSCKHNPSCSKQMVIDINQKGIKGMLQGIIRILTCVGKIKF